MLSRDEVVSDGELNALRRRLEAHASHYYPETNAHRWQARPCGTLDRPSARLHHFEVISELDDRRRVVVKLPRRRGLLSTDSNRPRLFPIGVHLADDVLEFRALRAIEAALEELDDPHLRWVRALDHMPDVGALVLDHVSEPPLSHVLRRHALRVSPRSFRHLGPVLHSLGRWARMYREIRLPGEPQRATRDEVATAVHAHVEYLASAGVAVDHLRGLPERFNVQARLTLPESLPQGMAHTDFSPRNVFVGAGGTIRVFDTLSFWRVPVFEDPAYFLTNVQTVGAQLASRGAAGWWAGTDALCDQLVRGAGLHSSADRDALQTYRVLLLLDKWSALRERDRRGMRYLDSYLAAAIDRCLGKSPEA